MCVCVCRFASGNIIITHSWTSYVKRTILYIICMCSTMECLCSKKPHEVCQSKHPTCVGVFFCCVSLDASVQSTNVHVVCAEHNCEHATSPPVTHDRRYTHLYGRACITIPLFLLPVVRWTNSSHFVIPRRNTWYPINIYFTFQILYNSNTQLYLNDHLTKIYDHPNIANYEQTNTYVNLNDHR